MPQTAALELAREPSELLAAALRPVRDLQLYVQVEDETADGGWIADADLLDPLSPASQALIERFGPYGFAANKKAAAASLLLRFGWASGPAIALFLLDRRILRVRSYALRFSASSLLQGLSIRSADVSPPRPADDGVHRELVEALAAFTEPVVEAYHQWSHFSRHALWAMATSSWAAQFANIGAQTGSSAACLDHVQSLFEAAPHEVQRAAPEIYPVTEGELFCTCQKRASCCLYFKAPQREFCASCPIIPKAERLDRNLDWLRAGHGASREATA